MSNEFRHHDASPPGAAGAQVSPQADPQALATAAQRRSDEEDFLWLMSDKRGRRLMWRQLLTPAGVFRNQKITSAATRWTTSEG